MVTHFSVSRGKFLILKFFFVVFFLRVIHDDPESDFPMRKRKYSSRNSREDFIRGDRASETKKCFSLNKLFEGISHFFRIVNPSTSTAPL